MIAPATFHQQLSAYGIEFFTGVPDSLFKSFLLYLQQHVAKSHHCITANEGQAVALAAGYHLATGKVPLVYMQNSGLGNAVNPLTSLADKEVYAIPMILLIGWRGRPGTKDEPQHIKMGRITEQLLQVMEIPFFVLPDQEAVSDVVVEDAVAIAMEKQQPVALLVPEDTFSNYEGAPRSINDYDDYPLNREEVLKQIMEYTAGDEVVVCTTGKTGREFYELNDQSDNALPKHFLSVGAMGLANHIALGIHLVYDGRVMVIDGDGALLMHMGSLPATGIWTGDDFIHIMINNGCHESVGGQPTLGFNIDWAAMARLCGFEAAFSITNEQELTNWLQQQFPKRQKQFVEIRVNAMSRNDLSRPSELPVERKEALMPLLRKHE